MIGSAMISTACLSSTLHLNGRSWRVQSSTRISYCPQSRSCARSGSQYHRHALVVFNRSINLLQWSSSFRRNHFLNTENRCLNLFSIHCGLLRRGKESIVGKERRLLKAAKSSIKMPQGHLRNLMLSPGKLDNKAQPKPITIQPGRSDVPAISNRHARDTVLVC